MTLSKASALRLAGDAMNMGAVALRGPLWQEEDGQFSIGDRNLTEWLGRYAGQELIVILAPVDTGSHTRLQQCGTCGRDYEGVECPHCAEARARLRGREGNKHPGLAGVFVDWIDQVGSGQQFQ
jgi:hypothetical protein